MKEYKIEIISIILLLIAYLIGNGFFFSINEANFLENYGIKKALNEIFYSQDTLLEIKLFIPIIPIVCFLYAVFGKSKKRIKIYLIFYLLAYLAKPIIEYKLLAEYFFNYGISFSYFKYIFFIFLCIVSAYSCYLVYEKNNSLIIGKTIDKNHDDYFK